MTFLPGERLPCYTDGLVESLPISKEGNQFDVWEKFLSEQPRTAMGTFCHDLLERRPVSSQSDSLRDDFIVVAVERIAPWRS